MCLTVESAMGDGMQGHKVEANPALVDPSFYWRLWKCDNPGHTEATVKRSRPLEFCVCV